MAPAAAPGRPESVFEQMRSWILDGSLPPGQRLPVRDVAEGLGVSTMPVRKALIRLGEVGLVTQQKNKGATVSELSLEDLRDLYGLRKLLEPASIQLGVDYMTPERLHTMRSTLQRLEAAVGDGDLATVLDADEEFLALIHAAPGNKQTMRIIRSTWARVRVYKLLFTTTAQVDAGRGILAENTRLLQIAEAGDGPAAREVIFHSLANAELQLMDFLRDRDAAKTSTRTSPAPGEPLATVLANLRRAHEAPVSLTSG